MDPSDHPAYGGHDDDFEPGRASGEYQVADVVPLHPAGTFARNTQGGDVINGLAEKLGVKAPNNVIKFPKKS